MPMFRNTLLTALALMTTVLPSTAAATEPVRPISTMLVGKGDSSEYPDPICSKCTIIVVEDETTAGERADLRITYPTDVAAFEGEIEVIVLLESGSRRKLWLSNVRLAPGDELELVAEAEADWSWDEARFVWLRFVPE